MAVLLATFGLTVFTDLTVAVGVGMVLASMLFMKRMAEVSNISAITREFSAADEELGDLKDPNSVAARDVPPGVEVYEINGPLFFGVADRLNDTLRALSRPPRVFVLRMRRVPAIDASGLHALEEFYEKCRRQGTKLLLSGVHAQPLVAFHRARFDERMAADTMFGSLNDALDRARRIVGAAGRASERSSAGSGGIGLGHELAVQPHEEAEDLLQVARLRVDREGEVQSDRRGAHHGDRNPQAEAGRHADCWFQSLIVGSTVPASTKTTPLSMSSAVMGNMYFAVPNNWKSPPTPMP